MCALRLPDAILRLLEQTEPRALERITKSSKWLIYSLDSAPREADQLYRAVRTLQVANFPGNVSEEEWDEKISWLRPADQDFDAPDVQHILDHHCRMVEHLYGDADETTEIDWNGYIFGFLVITEEDWREHGVTAVHCDKDRGKCKVAKCDHIPVDGMFLLKCVSQRYQHFDNVRSSFDDGSGNDGPDNQGGPPPIGEWQFGVYCTGSPGIDTYALKEIARSSIPDRRGDYSWPPHEASLNFFNWIIAAERINEDWPFAYAEFLTDPMTKAKRYTENTRPHPSLFVHIHGDSSNLDIEIRDMEWDHNITKAEEELRKIGRESRTIIRKCDAEELVAILELLALEK
jgi:hypothetical protein